MEIGYIVYQTTNLINNKIYVGVHKVKGGMNSKFDGYLGSGKYLNSSIKKYGKDNFKRETLFYFEIEELAYSKEAVIVNEEFINRDDTYL